MSFPNCHQKGHMHLLYNTASDCIEVSKCCHRAYEVFASIPVQAYLKLDPFQLVSQNFGKTLDGHNIKCSVYGENFICKYEEDKNLKCIEVGISHACNLKCPMCYARNSPHKDTENSKNAYFYTLEKLKQHNIAIRFTDWGEPFFWKNEVKTFFESLKENDFTYIELTTNATLIDDSLIQCLIKANSKVKLHIVVSLDSLDSNIYSIFRSGADITKTIQAIELLSKNGLLCAIAQTYSDINRADVDAIKSWCKKLQCEYFGYELSQEDSKNLIY